MFDQARSFQRDVEAMWHRLYRLAYSWCHDPHLAADLVQDTMAKALRNRNQLRDHASLHGWLFVILVNGWRDHCRSQRHTVDIETLDLAHEVDFVEERDRLATVQRVRTAMSRLSTEHREVLTLVVLEGMPYDEVAHVLGIPMGTVTSRLSRARNQLRRILRAKSTADQDGVNLRRVK